MRKKTLDLIFIAILAVLLIGAITLMISANGFSQSPAQVAGITSSNVTFDATGTQIITVAVKNGYEPRVINAMPGVPTIIRMNSQKTYGCERAFTLPTLGIVKNLPANGATDISIEPQEPGTSLLGSCTMGMYTFTINFN